MAESRVRPGASPMLEFRDVRFQYDSEDFSIIDRLSFTVKKGEFVSVIAPPAAEKAPFSAS